MEQSSRLEENLKNLSKIMAALKEFRDEVVPKKAKQMALWLENVDTKLEEFDALKKQINELNKGGYCWPKKNKGGYRTVRRRLNKELLEIQKTVNLLKVLGVELSNTTEALFNDLLEGKPKRFSHANLISFTSNFSKIYHCDFRGLGYQGQFPNGEQVGVKILAAMPGDILEPIFMSAINTMFKTSHRNLIKLHGFCFEENKKALVFEYMPNGSLSEVLFGNHGEEKIEWEKLYNIAIETGKGLSYLHDGCDEQLIHRDLKTRDVHLDSSYSPKISNFGMMKIMNRWQNDFSMSRDNVESYYDAPELSDSRSKVTYKCDVYSFGMILLEIFGRRANYEQETNIPKDFYWKKFKEGKVEELLTECGIPDKNRQEAKILCVVAFWCIQLTPENRPSMSTVVKMLEKEIQVISPPNPFVAATSLTKAYREVVYEDEDIFTPLI